MGAAFLAVAVADHDTDIDADQRADVADPVTVGTNDLNRLPFAGKTDRHLAHPRIFAAYIGVDFAQKLHLGFKRLFPQGIGVAIKTAVGADRGRSEASGITGPHRACCRDGTQDRRFGYFAHMGIALRFARDGAEAKTLCCIKTGGFNPAVIQQQSFRLPIFQK